jgi:hypothetical protein
LLLFSHRTHPPSLHRVSMFKTGAQLHRHGKDRISMYRSWCTRWMKVQDFQKKWWNGETAACSDRARHNLHELLTSVTSVFVQRPWRVPNTSQILLKIMGSVGIVQRARLRCQKLDGLLERTGRRTLLQAELTKSLEMGLCHSHRTGCYWL